jgi:methylglyoxal synthase
MVAWANANRGKLSQHQLWGTGTTGGRVAEGTGLPVSLLKSGPLGGDAQLGAMICEGRLDVLVFFQDPLTAMPHDVDIKSLQRLATLYDILFAPNRRTADAVLAAI